MTRLLVVVFGILILSHAAESGEVGVCYGTKGNNLPTTTCGVQLMQDHDITMVRVYDTDEEMMSALANTGIKVAVTLPNELIAEAAADPKCAEQWVRDNVEAFYPDTRIDTVCVGNEVFKSASDLTAQLLPAMENVYDALDCAGLADAVKVTTPVAFDAFTNTFPPSASVFRPDLAQSVMSPMLDFLDQTGSHLTVNIFPYVAYMADPKNFTLDYLLFRTNNGEGVHDPGSNLMYYSLFDAQLDAAYYAMDKLLSSRSGARGTRGRKLLQQGGQGDAVVGETNVPTKGSGGPAKPPHKTAAADDATCAACGVASVQNSKAYVGNLINRVVNGERVTGNRGTPYRPDADITVYIFALFNENQKEGPEEERNFGLFYPDQNQKPVFDVDFHGCNDDTRWCVANTAAGDASLQKALSFACGNGANCSAIQPGARCFRPDTVVAHASYAFNDYFQRHGRSSVACDFGGAGTIVNQEPKIGNCVLPSTPTDKIVAKTKKG